MTVLRWLSPLFIPLAILNLAGGIDAGIWFALLVQWNAVIWGIADSFTSDFLLGLTLFSAVLLARPGLWFADRFKPLTFRPLKCCGVR
jgi:hypothetical protein